MKARAVEALARAIYEAMERKVEIILLGDGFGGLSPVAREAFRPVWEKFGDRVMAVSISELGLAGAGTGAALAGCRPLVDLSTGSFIFQAWPQVVNEAPNFYYMTGGQSCVPVTFYSLAGIRGAGAAQHSHATHGMLGNVPGLQVLLPATVQDFYDLMTWCLLESQDPCVFLSHALLLLEEGELQTDVWNPPGRAAVLREGRDVTLVGMSVTVLRCLKAAEMLREKGISAEVINLRSVVPLDVETLLGSARRTGRVVIADECHRTFGAGAEIAASIAEKAWRELKAPPVRVATADVPIPFSPALEERVIVTAERVVEAALGLCEGRRS
jgi:pyruvate dehydrogenase E1 component beta subunit